jgi:cell division septum initiation protein DivIVA
MQKTNPELQADVKAAKDALAKAKAEIKELKEALAEEKATARAQAEVISDSDNLKSKVPAYEFAQPNELSPWFMFDGLRMAPNMGFYLHEKFVLSQDSGYADYLKDRARQTVDRAFDPQRVGRDYGNLPPFDRQNALNVIIYVSDGPE